MSTPGGDDWTTSGVLTAPSTTPDYNRTDSPVGTEQPYFAAWWTVSFPADTLVTLDTSPSPDDGDMYLKVFTGSTYAGRVLVAEDDDSGDGAESRLSFVASAGVIYHVAVGTYWTDGSGVDTYRMSVVAVPFVPPPNDNIANPAVLASGVETDILIGTATVETGETSIFGTWMNTGPEKSVWFRFTAAITGFVGFDELSGDDFWSPVWDLCSGTTMADVAVIFPGGQQRSPSTTAPVVAGQTYLVRIAAQRDTTVIATIRMQFYQWSDWVQDAEFSVAAISGANRVYKVPADEVLHSFGGGEDQLAWVNGMLATQHGTISTEDGLDDDWLTRPDPGSGLVNPGDHLWRYNVKISTATPNVGQMSAVHQTENRVVQPNYFGTWADTGSFEYESNRAKIVGCSLAVAYQHQRSAGGSGAPTNTLSGEVTVLAYVPSKQDDFLNLAAGYERIEILAATSLTDTLVTGTAALVLGEADFDAQDSRAAVWLWAALQNASAPTVAAAFAGQEYAIQLFANVSATGTFTLRPPRYRFKQIVVASTAVGSSPLRRYPRTYNRHYPRRRRGNVGGTY